MPAGNMIPPDRYNLAKILGSKLKTKEEVSSEGKPRSGPLVVGAVFSPKLDLEPPTDSAAPEAGRRK